jgi:hypothetical protein
MFGKIKDDDDMQALTTNSGDGVFGDEVGAAQAALINELVDRIEQTEAQMRSQFTSMAAYAQIAQEQIDLARGEAKAEADRTHAVLTKLIERERADRIAAIGSAPKIDAIVDEHAALRGAIDEITERLDVTHQRLDAVEAVTSELATGLRECLALQKTLAEAISIHFTTQPAPAPTRDRAETSSTMFTMADLSTVGVAEGAADGEGVDPPATVVEPSRPSPFASPPVVAPITLSIPPLPGFDGDQPPEVDPAAPIPGLSLAG